MTYKTYCFDLSEFPIDKRTLNYLAEGVCAFLKCRFNKPVNFAPVFNLAQLLTCRNLNALSVN